MSERDVRANRTLSSEGRARLAEFGDVLIRGGAGLPTAREAAIHTAWVDRVLTARPDLLAPLMNALSGSGDPAECLNHWQTNQPAVFEMVSFVVAASYFMNPDVRRRLGYPGDGPVPNPARPDEADFYLSGGILDVVRERGPLYRAVPPCEPTNPEENTSI